MTVATSTNATTANPVEAVWFAEVREGLSSARLAPYLGPLLIAHSGSDVPSSPEALAAFFGKKVALPRWGRSNAWAAAQYIETRKHRDTLIKWMAEAFATPVTPLPFHLYLASLNLPLIISTWYDGAMRVALAERSDWGEIQGISRARIGENRWYRAYDHGGAEVPINMAARWTTLLYQPHGGVVPDRNFLIADSDYVEVLTEIDIQTPIPDAIKSRRTGLGFVFLGCRFHDQLLRTYARQILKRSKGPNYAVIDGAITRNERRFLDEVEMRVVSCSLGDALARLTPSSGLSDDQQEM